MPSIGGGSSVGMSKMLVYTFKFFFFFVMGKALTGELPVLLL